LDRLCDETSRRLYAYRNELIKVGEKDDGSPKFKNKAGAWLDHWGCLKYDTVVFIPGESTPPDVLNLWRGFGFTPKPGDWSNYKAHMLDNICQSDEKKYS
jgi:hypothetical protein